MTHGQPTAIDAEIWEAIDLASLTSFVKRQTWGGETMIVEQGMKLSGVERQRVGD